MNRLTLALLAAGAFVVALASSMLVDSGDDPSLPHAVEGHAADAKQPDPEELGRAVTSLPPDSDGFDRVLAARNEVVAVPDPEAVVAAMEQRDAVPRYIGEYVDPLDFRAFTPSPEGTEVIELGSYIDPGLGFEAAPPSDVVAIGEYIDPDAVN